MDNRWVSRYGTGDRESTTRDCMTVRLADVFGIRTAPVKSYVERPSVDGAFEQALQTDHHIVIYGSSKQGKTALRQKHLDDDDDCVIVRPSPRTDMEGLYQPILRDAGIRIETEQSTRTEAGSTSTLRTGFKALIPWVGGVDVGMEGQSRRGNQQEFRSEFIGFNLAEAQSIGELLRKAQYAKYVVIENFHYLAVPIQKQLAFDLKTFHEIGRRFIILGIWRES